ncbi:hypothetical protein RB620_08570 [Paenibacillus sp. LHD-117]|uniref:hypothetical protein n=1 Tax=Paenibacillus sp. LHD-117 TaxID=3071412 RepID=UPI0027E0F55B|nr:hypothetical protein [Paenibacillus sp. LHD-117]MDQ6419484.1 hypothetical protein [Paenibacillus sp. LHD-117]
MKLNLAAVMKAVSLVSVLVAPKLGVARSEITVIGSGSIQFAFAALGLIRFFSA